MRNGTDMLPETTVYVKSLGLLNITPSYTITDVKTVIHHYQY